MKAEEKTPEQLLLSGDQYVIPLFQRYYKWDDENWKQIWDDVELLLEPGEEQRRHFLGSIVCVPERQQPGNVKPFQVIDGQQRLMTLSILFCAIRGAANQIGATELANEIGTSYLFHQSKKGHAHFKILPRIRDRNVYQALVKNSESADGSRISDAYGYFSDCLADGGYCREENILRQFLTAVSDRIDLVVITLGNENPYKIFKSLNSTGEPLEEGDLIRNHVFMALAIEEQDEFDEKQWQPLEKHFKEDGNLNDTKFAAFFRDALLREGKYIGKNATYEFFEKRYPREEIKPLELVPEFEKLARLYDVLENRKGHGNSKIESAINTVRDLKVTVSYPLLLRLLVANQEGHLTDEALVRCLRMISSFVLRRYVCGLTSRAYNRLFCVVCNELKENIESNLHKFLEDKEWPKDKQFIESFVKMNLYSSNYARAVLDGIEYSLQKENARVILDNCSIEHVMPRSIEDNPDGESWRKMLGGDEWQDQHNMWLHTPGNLTLVGGNYNISMSNREFSVKKRKLKSSKVYLNEYFSAHTPNEWTADEIEKRGRVLGHKAANLWPGPNAPA